MVRAATARPGVKAQRTRGDRRARRKPAPEVADKRQSILDAALDEFAARGFADTRLDDVARRAGVAKGTIYLYFSDKESLFQDLVRTRLSPLIGTIEAAAVRELPIRALAELIITTFVEDIYGTRRKDVIRLIISEGTRFPELAKFYYSEVIGRVLPMLRQRLRVAVERGELGNDALARFPQLLVAPALMAILWNGLFGRFEPLDVGALMRAHLALLFNDRGAS